MLLPVAIALLLTIERRLTLFQGPLNVSLAGVGIAQLHHLGFQNLRPVLRGNSQSRAVLGLLHQHRQLSLCALDHGRRSLWAFSNHLLRSSYACSACCLASCNDVGRFERWGLSASATG